MEKKQKVLVLGANGFIGSTLVTHLLAKTKHEVFAVDLDQHKLKHCFRHERFHFYERDLLVHQDSIEELVKRADVVFPLVAIANPRLYVEEPIKVFELDFEANLHIIRLCVLHKKRLIFPSTSEVYGLSADKSFDEMSTNFVLGPTHKQRWIYSCCKQLLDRVIYAYGQKEGLDYTIFRPFNFIGPKQDDINNPKNSRVVTQFIHNILNGKPLQLTNGGEQKRCFTFIDDGVECLLKILENKEGKACGKIFNIGNPGENYSIKALAEMIISVLSEFDEYRELSASVKMENVDAQEYYNKFYQDVDLRVPDVGAANELLGWQPKVGLKDALRTILEYHLKGIDRDKELLLG